MADVKSFGLLWYKVFEVRVSLESPLMSEAQCRNLNPTVITVHRASNLPTQHLTEQQQRYDITHAHI